MKTIIRGKRYDTEAKGTTLVAEDSSVEGPGDFRYWHEGLYRTLHGRWFLAGKGGPMTRWARSAGQNASTSGSGIRPMADDEARQWLEQAQANDALEQYFGDEIEDA